MRYSTNKKLKAGNLIPLFFFLLAFGVAALVFYFIGTKNSKIPDNYVETTSEVIDIRNELIDEDYTYYATITYNYENTSYTDEITVNSNSKIGDTYTIYVNPDNPNKFKEKVSSSDYNFLLVISIGLISVGIIGETICVIKIINAKKFAATYKENNIKKDSMLDEEFTFKIEENTEAKKYIFYKRGIVKKDYYLKNDNDQIIFEAKADKRHIFTNNKYTFNNKITNALKEHTIGVTKTTSTGNDNTSIALSSSFIYDGIDVFKYLEEHGYYTKMSFKNIMHPIVHVLKTTDEKEVATFNLLIKNKSDKPKLIDFEPFHDEITAYTDDIELIFLIGIIFDRVQPAASQM